MSSRRFPTSLRKMRTQFPDGPLVQVRLVTEKDSIIECEGKISKEDLLSVVDIVTKGFKKGAKKNG